MEKKFYLDEKGKAIYSIAFLISLVIFVITILIDNYILGALFGSIFFFCLFKTKKYVSPVIRITDDFLIINFDSYFINWQDILSIEIVRQKTESDAIIKISRMDKGTKKSKEEHLKLKSETLKEIESIFKEKSEQFGFPLRFYENLEAQSTLPIEFLNQPKELETKEIQEYYEYYSSSYIKLLFIVSGITSFLFAVYFRNDKWIGTFSLGISFFFIWELWRIVRYPILRITEELMIIDHNSCFVNWKDIKSVEISKSKFKLKLKFQFSEQLLRNEDHNLESKIPSLMKTRIIKLGIDKMKEIEKIFEKKSKEYGFELRILYISNL
jgi:hypothetical protein